MELRSVRHDKALRLAEQKILCSRLARYVKELYIYGSAARGAEKWNSDIDLLLVLDPEKKGNREIKREIIYLKGSITEEDIDAPEIDLKVVFGDDWKKSSQTYYKNILQEGKQIWQRDHGENFKPGSSADGYFYCKRTFVREKRFYLSV